VTEQDIFSYVFFLVWLEKDFIRLMDIH